MNKSDLIIIGAGPGGYELALAAAKKGLKVTLIEKDKVGGTCLNHGCIPTKTYYHDACIYQAVKHLNEIKGLLTFQMSEAKLRKDEVVTTLRNNIEQQLALMKVELIYGKAYIIKEHQVEVNNTIIEADKIVIATGSTPRRLTNDDFDQSMIMTSDEILEITTLPTKLCVIGGGVIGIELASIFNNFGVEVTIIESDKRILNSFDSEIVRRYTNLIKQQGIKVITNELVTTINNGKVITNQDNIIETDLVLMAIGRTSNLDLLVKTNNLPKMVNNKIIVDDFFETSIKDLYAIGDVVYDKPMLAHFATYSGYKLLNHLLNKEDEIDLSLVPSVVFGHYEIAMIGLTEDEAKLEQITYQTKKVLFRSNGKAISMAITDGFIKIIIVDDEIIGAHILGTDANLLIHELAVMMKNHVKVSKIKDYIHAHPTISELISQLGA